MTRVFTVLLGAGLLLTGCAAEEPVGPPLDMRHDVRQLMAGMIDPAADGLSDAGKGVSCAPSCGAEATDAMSDRLRSQG